MRIVFTQEEVAEIVLQHVKDVYNDGIKHIKVNPYSEDFIVASDE